MPADHTFLHSAQNFKTMLTELQSDIWPPDEADALRVARACALLIECLDAWESATHGENVFDVEAGEITTADARRRMAQEIALSYEGDIAVLLVAPAQNRIRMEIRARVDEFHGLLRDPELVMDWECDGTLYERTVPLRAKGPQWYMLSQLRDDVKEGRFLLR